MWWKGAQRAFVRCHYQRHDDGKLGDALGVDAKAVARMRDRFGLERDKEQRRWIRANPDEPLDPYTGLMPPPENVRTCGKMDFGVAGLAALVAFAVYVSVLSPTVTGEDSGELITAAYTMGVAHPPGYPLWCLLGKLYTVAVPFGSVAWRVALLSATLGAAAAGIVALLVIKLTASRWAGVAAALALAFSSEFWEQSTIAEVYALNIFLIVLCMLLLFRWQETHEPRLLLAFAFVYGLGLCNHHTVHFLGPVFAAFILGVDREPWRRWGLYTGMAGVAAGVWLIHLYLPIRSMADPPVDWGNPETWQNFWDVVMRRQYTFGFTKDPRTLDRFGRQLSVVGRLYANEFTPWLAAMPLLGVYALWRRARYRLVFIACALAYLTLGFIFALNFDLDKESIWVNNVFFIPSYTLAAVLLGAGLAWLLRARIRGVPLAPIGVAACVAAAVVPLMANHHHNDKSGYFFAHDYAANILKTLEPDAIYFPTADHATFPVLYLQAVEGRRPDIVIGNKYGYPEFDLYKDMPFEFRSQFGVIPSEKQQHAIEDWIVANTDRPVYFTHKRPIKSLPGASMVPRGLLYCAVRPGEAAPQRDYWSEYSWHTLDSTQARGEFTAELILADYHFFRGIHLLTQDDRDAALDQFEAALDAGGASKQELNNVATACAEHGLGEAAIGYYERALELDPEYELVLRNLGKLSLQQDNPAKAVAAWRRVLALEPLDREANWMLVDALKRGGWFDELLAHLSKMAQFGPDDPAIYREMGLVLLNEKQDTEQARAMFAKSLKLDPNQPELRMLMADNAAPQPDAPSLPGPPGLPEAPTAPPAPGPVMPKVPNGAE